MNQPKFPRMHISLYVKDIFETLAFYRKFFGQEPEKIQSGYAKFHVMEPPLIISFVENPERVSPGFGHLGIQVDSEEELKSRLTIAENKGLKTKEEMGTNCCYAFQDKFWAADPDGHQWEIYFFHQDVEFNDPRYQKESAEACCVPSDSKQTVGINDITVDAKPKVALAAIGVDSGNPCEPGSGCC
ncbi:MAG: catechol 2,3-dioxygenase-like lactoylglutathione lyase family enzyme [Sphingobacteriales bacterium]|jgi:catechol 2,3-dioxygenase-like lactoylglutathione lyase family enzyme